MSYVIPDLDLPIIREPDSPPPLVSSEAAMRWRISKNAGCPPILREGPQGEAFDWQDQPTAIEPGNVAGTTGIS